MTKSKDLVTVSGGLSVPADLVEFYKENAGLGSENLSGAMPQLKINESNSHNEMGNGEEAPAGTFFYSPTKEMFKTVRASIMSISRGFYGVQKDENGNLPKREDGSIKTDFTQLVGGMILETTQPFVMFASGTRLQNMWNFGKEIKPFTRQVPMFSFEVELGLERVKQGSRVWHVVTYKVIRDANGQIQLIGDRELLAMLKQGVDSMNDMFEGFIEQNEVDRYTGVPLKEKAVTDTFNAVAQVEEPEQVEETMPEPTEEEMANSQAEDISDDVPF